MVKKKILLFGATGMAGHMAYYYLQCTGKYDLVNVVYRTQLTDDSIVVDMTGGMLSVGSSVKSVPILS